MTDYPDNEQDRKKALAANEKFHKALNNYDETPMKVAADIAVDKITEIDERATVKDAKSKIDELVNQRHFSTRATEFLHNASWHLTQALKIIDGVK